MRWRLAALRGARALSQSEAQLRSVFSVMGDGVVLHDEQGRLLPMLVKLTRLDLGAAGGGDR